MVEHFVSAITGGTGEFNAASGQAFVTDTSSPRNRIVFQLV
jgi:hypothetical protein